MGMSTEKRDTAPMERITCAAIQFHLQGGVNHLCPGTRHDDIRETFYGMHKRSGWAPIKSYEEGFLTDTGRFLTRREAMALARENGQLRRPTNRAELNSEDLW